MNYSLFISCAKGLEYLLEYELKHLGLHVTRVSPQGVFGEASLEVIYHICLWTRLANRVNLVLFSGQAHNDQTLYQLCNQFHWQTVFTVDKSIAIEFHGQSKHIRNAMYGAQVVKDAIVDHFRKQQKARPSVDRNDAQIRLQAYLNRDTLTVSLDLTGYSLHQRGYRERAGKAPLKETLACAMLLRAGWPKLAEQGYAFYDPFCGSGTLVIEAAMMASHTAPGLLRQDQAFVNWAGHQPHLWEKARQLALKQVRPPKAPIQGSDADGHLTALAQENAEKASMGRLVEFFTLNLEECKAPQSKGLIVCNPPYGERLGDPTQLVPLYQQLGFVMHKQFQGWLAAVLTSKTMLSKAIGLRSEKQYALFNGALECKLYQFQLSENNLLKNNQPGTLSPGATMFANRLKKNVSHLRKWAQKQNISCYRVYDADLPEYAFAVDVYDGYAVLQEYAPPASIAAHKAEKRSLEAIQVVPQVLEIAHDKLIIKTRQQQKGRAQYQKAGKSNETLTVREGKAELKVNLHDYLDTGLFLDHRPLRLMFSELPAKTRFLNLFCYTATASVHAALAGAFTTNVDLSNTYLRWAEENFKLNQLDVARHQFIQFDCMEWLKLCRDQFDVIFLDPPSFSNSKRMKSVLDIQRDHDMLIRATMRLLKPEGKLYFSTNLRRFKLADALKDEFEIQDISRKTIDEDFKRNTKIHHCFVVKKKNAPSQPE